MAYSRQKAFHNALNARTNVPGMCLKHVRTWLGIPARYPDAISAWHHAGRRVTSRTPPPGIPVFFAGGRHGHIALSLGNGKIRTTDWPRGRVGTTTIAELERRWHYRYLGASFELNGQRIGSKWN